MNIVSKKIENLKGSEIIKLAGEINQLKQQGKEIFNLTIGDFDPSIFPIPNEFKAYIQKAYEQNKTNYPPAEGTKELILQLLAFIQKNQSLNYSDSEILIAGGGRPLIYSAFTTLIDDNDLVVYPVPSWNNNHYSHLSNARTIEIDVKPENGFLPVASEIKPYIQDATLIAVCSPLNPSGTCFNSLQLKEICELVLEENQKRKGIRKPLYLLYDQIYCLLLSENIEHVHPVALFPEMKEFTIYIDGISKALAATGIRIGWSMGPQAVISKMKSLLGHIGAWAPKPEQMALAEYFANEKLIAQFLYEINHKINKRTQFLYEEIIKMKSKGFPVDAIKPQGAIYLSVQFNLIGKTCLEQDISFNNINDITQFLLNEANIAIVPFTAFGCNPSTNWFRVSVGTIKEEELVKVIINLKNALSKVVVQ